MQALMISQSTQELQIQKIKEIKTQITQMWFAAVAERDAGRKRSLLEKYRELRRRLEVAQSL